MFNCNLPASEVVILTAVIRDLHKCYPGVFTTDVRTPFPEFWEHNPYITRTTGTFEIVECETLLLRKRDNATQHVIRDSINYYNEKLGLQIQPTLLKGDIHLSNEEKLWSSQAKEIVGEEMPFWIIVAGDNEPHSVRRWESNKFQQVINHFRGKIQFVQIGEPSHPRLKNVIELLGKVNLRQLIRLIYHCQGIVCLNTIHAHLAAAVETKFPHFTTRPCVVVAGGTEAVHWGTYAGHQFIHTVGALSCCLKDGCGKTHIHDSNIEEKSHSNGRLCINLFRKLPRCMAIIEAKDVIQKIEIYFRSSYFPSLIQKQNQAASAAIKIGSKVRWDSNKLEIHSFRQTSERFIKHIPPYPNQFDKRGVVICAGGQYLQCAWVCIRMLRKLGCKLPIELWHLGVDEMDENIRLLLKQFGVRCVNAFDVRKRHPARELAGWPLKAYAIKHCKFEEVLLLDADNVPVQNPDYLFETHAYQHSGAIFWPDIRRGITPIVWKLFGIPYIREPEFESGQIIINKRRCWRALCLALWFNEHGDFYYRHILGDKDTFHLAFRKLRKSFSLIHTSVERIPGTMCQHDFKGRRIFQHRNQYKWLLNGSNQQVPGFQYEDNCLSFLDELRLKWLSPPRESVISTDTSQNKTITDNIKTLTTNIYEYYRIGFDSRRMSFKADGTIGLGLAPMEKFWQLTFLKGQLWLEIFSEKNTTCRLTMTSSGSWVGQWNYFEKMPIKLTLESKMKRVFSLPIKSEHRRILFRAPLNGYTGYGLHANQIVTDLQKSGYDFYIRAIDINETFAPIPLNVRKAIVCQEYPSKWELVLFPPSWAPVAGKKTVHFTMWESTKLHWSAISNLNRCECIIVPTQWNASCFVNSGVKSPIYIVPLGINTDVFRYSPMDMIGPCIFGTAGRLESGGTRKGINLVISAFKQAFPRQKNVQLYVKIFPDCEIPSEADERIKFNREYFSEMQMANWYQHLTCFVSAARGEGWGLMQHQALAMGRPIISIRFGGTAEFFDEQMGYPLDFKLIPAEDLYIGCGLWADPDEKHLIHLMRRVYSDREEAGKLGLKATIATSKYSWSESSQKLRKVLQGVGMVE